jgi:hypothetical protein
MQTFKNEPIIRPNTETATRRLTRLPTVVGKNSFLNATQGPIMPQMYCAIIIVEKGKTTIAFSYLDYIAPHL